MDLRPGRALTDAEGHTNKALLRQHIGGGMNEIAAEELVLAEGSVDMLADGVQVTLRKVQLEVEMNKVAAGVFMEKNLAQDDFGYLFGGGRIGKNLNSFNENSFRFIYRIDFMPAGGQKNGRVLVWMLIKSCQFFHCMCVPFLFCQIDCYNGLTKPCAVVWNKKYPYDNMWISI